MPGLAVILGGRRQPRKVYAMKNKTLPCQSGHLRCLICPICRGWSGGLTTLIRRSIRSACVPGVLQLPIPAGLPVGEILDVLDPLKDVDGLPNKALGQLWLGKRACAVYAARGDATAGRVEPRSFAGTGGGGAVDLGGQADGGLLLAADATVTICHRGRWIWRIGWRKRTS